MYVTYILHVYFRFKERNRLKVKGQKKIQHAKSNHKRTGVPKTNIQKKTFKTKIVTRDKKRHYFIIKGSVQQEDKTIITYYICNNRASKYTKQRWTKLKRETGN